MTDSTTPASEKSAPAKMAVVNVLVFLPGGPDPDLEGEFGESVFTLCLEDARKLYCDLGTIFREVNAP